MFEEERAGRGVVVADGVGSGFVDGGPVSGEDVEILAELGGEAGFEEADGEGRGDFGGTEFAGFREQGDVIDFEGGASAGAGFALDTDEAAGERDAAVAHFHAGSPHGAEEIGEGAFVADREAEFVELAVGRERGVVADGGDAAAVQVEDSEGLENVVELAGGEGDGDVLLALYGAPMIEVPNSVLIENYSFDRYLTECQRDTSNQQGEFHLLRILRIPGAAESEIGGGVTGGDRLDGEGDGLGETALEGAALDGVPGIFLGGEGTNRECRWGRAIRCEFFYVADHLVDAERAAASAVGVGGDDVLP